MGSQAVLIQTERGQSLSPFFLSDNRAPDLTDNRPLVYRFQFVAADSEIRISLTNGTGPSHTAPNPYVNAMMVTRVVHEPSVLILSATSLLGPAFRRNRPDVSER